MKKNFIERLLPIFALLTWVFLFGIMLILFIEGTPIFKSVPIFRFIFGRHWYPVHEPPEFGILPLICGSLMVTVGALIIAIPFGLGCAIYLSEIANRAVREVVKPFIEMLAGVPSVVYGFFGMVLLAPMIQKIFHLSIGLTAFTASVILGVMALPTVASIAEDAISSVPKALREASFALGANQWETITRVVVPAAKSGIFAAIILGIGRAIGETMTVLMIAGCCAVITPNFFKPVRPMTATIAAEMGEAPMGSMHYHALFAIGLVLFLITIGLSLIAERFKER
ncbi:phosphate ABC transporter permease subunit PstC [candidate division WOR-3 bacterium]|nr:phosphate ABC transporter permease subunit PstC [candidate division WOR-3 bacterium]